MKDFIKIFAKNLIIIFISVATVLFISDLIYAKQIGNFTTAELGENYPPLSKMVAWIEKDMGLDPESVKIKYLKKDQIPSSCEHLGGWVRQDEPNTIYINTVAVHNTAIYNSSIFIWERPQKEYLTYIRFIAHELQHIKQIRIGSMDWGEYINNNYGSDTYSQIYTEEDAENTSKYYRDKVLQIMKSKDFSEIN